MLQDLSSNVLLNPENRQHVALLYDDVNELNQQIANYINEGLGRGHFCVYATIHYRDDNHIAKFASLIKDYKEHVAKDNLLVVDLAPFYISAMLGDMMPFEAVKKLFVEKAKARSVKHVRFVGDATGFLFKNKHFDECALVEQWWQDKPFEGSYVCPFPASFFKSYPHDMHSKRTVVKTHDCVLEIPIPRQDQETPKSTQNKMSTNNGDISKSRGDSVE